MTNKVLISPKWLKYFFWNPKYDDSLKDALVPSLCAAALSLRDWPWGKQRHWRTPVVWYEIHVVFVPSFRQRVAETLGILGAVEWPGVHRSPLWSHPSSRWWGDSGQGPGRGLLSRVTQWLEGWDFQLHPTISGQVGGWRLKTINTLEQDMMSF